MPPGEALNRYPQRAFVDTLRVEDDAAALDVRVDVDEGRMVVELALDETRAEDKAAEEPEHVPNFALHPVPQYALVDPQYLYLLRVSIYLKGVGKDLLTGCSKTRISSSDT